MGGRGGRKEEISRASGEKEGKGWGAAQDSRCLYLSWTEGYRVREGHRGRERLTPPGR